MPRLDLLLGIAMVIGKRLGVVIEMGVMIGMGRIEQNSEVGTIDAGEEPIYVEK